MDAAPLIARDTAAELAEHAHWEFDPSLPYWGGEVDVCINAMTLANGLWLGADVSPLVDWFVEHTMDQGCWNCEWQHGSRRASFHSTLNASRSLHENQRLTGGTAPPRETHCAGMDYLLGRNLPLRTADGAIKRLRVSDVLYLPGDNYAALRRQDHLRRADRRGARM